MLPPKGLPLWFHTNISLFPREIEKINDMLADSGIDIILLQGTHEGLTGTYMKFLKIIDENKNYTLLRRIQDSPANATWPCGKNCEGDIFIYIKKTK